MNSGARHKAQRHNRVKLKADAAILLDRIAALSLNMPPTLRLEMAEMRLRLAPAPGTAAPIVHTDYVT